MFSLEEHQTGQFTTPTLPFVYINKPVTVNNRQSDLTVSIRTMNTGSFRTAIAQLSLELSKEALKRRSTQKFIKNTTKIVHDIVLLCHRLTKEEDRKNIVYQPESVEVVFEHSITNTPIDNSKSSKVQENDVVSTVCTNSTEIKIDSEFDQFLNDCLQL